MKIGILSGRKSIGGMEREAACLARVLVRWGEDVWFFQRDAWFWQDVAQNDPASWFELEGLELINQEGLIEALAESDVVFLPQAAVVDTEEFAPYINAVPWVVELNGYMPKFLSPHKILHVDRYLSHINIYEEQAVARQEPLEKFWDWPGQPVWIESEPAEVTERGQLTFGCLSRQDWLKKLDVLIDAFKGIGGEHKLVLVGDGHEGEKLREYAADNERISFPGMINDRAEVERWFKSFDVFVMTSGWEGGSASVKEAMALGVPCIVSDGGGTPALVGDAAVVVGVGDVEGVRKAMLRMVDTDVRRDYRERGLKRIEELTETAEETIAAVLAEAARVPRVSVVVPVAPAHSELVIEAVDSIADQELWPLEAIVVDDGGTVEPKGLPDFVRCFRLEEQSGCRPGVPRNFGIDQAVAKAIFMLDADDVVFAGGIQALYRAWRRDPCGIKYGGVYQEGPKGEIEKCMPKEWDSEHGGRGGIHSISSLFSKELWACIGGFPEDDITFEDARFFAVAETIWGGERVKEYIIVYRLHTGRQWWQHVGFRKIMNDPSKRAEYHVWIQDKIKEVVAMGNCPGCGGSRGGGRGRGRGVVMGSSPVASGAASGMDEKLVAIEFLGKETRYPVSSKMAGTHGILYRFGSRVRDRVKYVLPGDVEWMVASGLFKLKVTPVVAKPVPEATEVTEVDRSLSVPPPTTKVGPEIQAPFSGPLGEVDLPPQVKALLIGEGINTVEAIRGTTLEKLLGIRGIGKSTVKQIREATGDTDDTDNDQPGDVEVDKPARKRERATRPAFGGQDSRRRTRPRRRDGQS